ncbi:hypothetical protein AAK938_01365 [Aerococcaceae bacterium 50-4]
MGGRGQTSVSAARLPGESTLKYRARLARQARMAKAGTTETYTGRSYSQNGVTGREVITNSYDKRGNKTTASKYEVNGKEVGYNEFRNNEPVFDMRRTTTYDRNAKRRKAKFDTWFNAGR